MNGFTLKFNTQETDSRPVNTFWLIPGNKSGHLILSIYSITSQTFIWKGECLERKCCRQINTYFMSSKLLCKFYIFQDNYTQQHNRMKGQDRYIMCTRSKFLLCEMSQKLINKTQIHNKI